jgi:peptidoglycan hydrolase CwlO-like protein
MITEEVKMNKKIISAILFTLMIVLINGCQPAPKPQDTLEEEPVDEHLEDAMEETSGIADEVDQDISGIDEVDQDLDDSELEDLDSVLEDIGNI